MVMSIYVWIQLVIIAVGCLLTKTRLRLGRKEVDGRRWFFVIIAAMLVFISAFRGDFASDYRSYASEFDRFDGYSLQENFKADTHSEPGYIIFQYLVGLLFDNSVYIFVFSSLLVVLSNLQQLKEYADEPIIAVMLFVIVGMYYPSFNVMRQCMAASILLFGNKYLYERNFFKYFFIVLLASTFHMTALIMIPFYFVSTINFGKKFFVVYMLLFAATLLIAPRIIALANAMVYTNYNLSLRGQNFWKTIVLPVALTVFATANYFINRRESTSETNYILQRGNRNVLTGAESVLTVDVNNIWLNGTIVYVFFKVYGLFLDLADRISIYFSIYLICFYVHQICKSKFRKPFVSLTAVMLVVYEMIVNTLQYYFIWES